MRKTAIANRYMQAVFIRHTGNTYVTVTDGVHTVEVSYGDTSRYRELHVPIEAIHYKGIDWEAVYLKVQHTETKEIKYYHGAVNRRLGGVKSSIVGGRLNCIVLLPIDQMSYGVVLLDYVLNKRGTL